MPARLRCRILECIKHFFSVEKVIFVISIDRNALEESVRAVYGQGIDLDEYLRKFIDYHIELHEPDYKAFVSLLGRSFRPSEVIQQQAILDMWIRLFSTWCGLFRLSLRVQEQMMSQANFVLRSYGSRKSSWMYYLVAILSCVRAREQSLFERLYRNDINLPDLPRDVEALFLAREEDTDSRMVKFGLAILYAGFYSVHAIEAQIEVVSKRLHVLEADRTQEGQDLEAQLKLLRGAADLAGEERSGNPLGPRVCQRMLFLAG